MKHIHKKLLSLSLLLVSVWRPIGAKGGEILLGDSVVISNDKDVQIAYRKIASKDQLGGVSVVDVENLMEKNYYTGTLDNMQAFVGGWHNSLLWGLNDYLSLVDGTPRDLDSVKPDEIESITFLKGAQAVVLYGSRAAKGAILVPLNVVRFLH